MTKLQPERTDDSSRKNRIPPVIQQGYRVLYREAHILLEELADAKLDGNRKQHMELLTSVPLLIIDDMGMRKLPLTAAEELLEIIRSLRALISAS